MLSEGLVRGGSPYCLTNWRRPREGSAEQPWWRLGGSVKNILYSPSPNPKIKTLHGCAEGVADSL